MLRLRNKTRSSSKIGYIVKAVRGGFEYAGLGDTPIGVVREVVAAGTLCEIQVTGDALVWVGRTVSEGDALRLTIQNEGGGAGVAYPIGEASAYTALGSAIGKGKGLVQVALNLSSAGVISGEVSGLPPGGATGTVLTKQSAADEDADWAVPSTGIPDATPNSIAYSRYNNNWVNSNLVIDYSGGTGTQLDTIQYGETLTFNATGDLSVAYDPVNNIITYNHNASAVYTDWNLYVNGTKEKDITSGAYVNFAAGTGISLAFTDPGSPPMNTVTITSTITSPWDTVTGGINYAGGNVGIGTTSPTILLQITSATDTSTNRFKLTANSVDVLKGGNTAGSGGFLEFKNTAGSTTALIRGYGDSYFNGGNFGIGDSTPSYTLDVTGTCRITSQIYSNSEITAYSSDGRLKHSVVNIVGAMDMVDKINGVHYSWKDGLEDIGFKPTRKREIGFIAQNLLKVIPEAVVPAPFDHDEDGNSISGQGYMTVKPEKVIPLLVEALKEVNHRLKILERGNSKY